MKARTELSDRHVLVIDEQKRVAERVEQMEQDMLTLKSKLAEAKTKLKGMMAGKPAHQVNAEATERTTPGERKVRRAMERFDRLQAQVDNLEARVRSYEVGGPSASAWKETADTRDPAIEEELERMKQRLAEKSPRH